MYISSGTVVRNSKTNRKQLFLHTLTALGCEARGPQTNTVLAILSYELHLSCQGLSISGGRVVHVFVRGGGHVYTSAREGRGNPAPTPALACSRLLLLSIESQRTPVSTSHLSALRLQMSSITPRFCCCCFVLSLI